MPDITKVAAQLAQRVKDGPRVCSIDVSAHFNEPEGTTVWEYSETTIPTYYQALADGEKAKDKYPDLAPELRAQIAGWALTHRAPSLPQGMVPYVFYANIARGDARLWALLNSRYAEAFPEISALSNEEAMAEAKKNSTEAPSDTSSPSASKNSTATRRSAKG